MTFSEKLQDFKPGKKPRRDFLTARQANHLLDWVQGALSRISMSSDTVQNLVERRMVDIYSDFKFYLQDRGVLRK